MERPKDSSHRHSEAAPAPPRKTHKKPLPKFDAEAATESAPADPGWVYRDPETLYAQPDAGQPEAVLVIATSTIKHHHKHKAASVSEKVYNSSASVLGLSLLAAGVGTFLAVGLIAAPVMMGSKYIK